MSFSAIIHFFEFVLFIFFICKIIVFIFLYKFAFAPKKNNSMFVLYRTLLWNLKTCKRVVSAFSFFFLSSAESDTDTRTSWYIYIPSRAVKPFSACAAIFKL